MMSVSLSILEFACTLIIFLQAVLGQNVIPETLQEFHACVGTTAYIPWPLNAVSRSGRDSTVITLTFQHRRSERKVPIATFNKHRKLIAEGTFRNRLYVSQESSGIFLKQVSLDDMGTFVAQARMRDGDVWTRSTNLIVHFRPIVVDEKLNLSIVQTTKGQSGRGDCLTLSCGKLEFVGYPPAHFVWMSDSKVLASEEAKTESHSTFEICSPFHGQVSCMIGGYSSTCMFDHVVSINLDLPGPPGNVSAVRSGTSSSEYLLMIGMPALAIGIPLLILGLWVLTHLLKSYPQYREHRHPDKDHSRENHQPSPSATFIEVNSLPSTSHQNQVQNQTSQQSLTIEDLTLPKRVSIVDREDGQIRILAHSPVRRKEAELERRPDTPHRPAHESDDEEDDDDEDDDDEDDSDEQPDEDHKEDQPLMEDSITPTML